MHLTACAYHFSWTGWVAISTPFAVPVTCKYYPLLHRHPQLISLMRSSIASTRQDAVSIASALVRSGIFLADHRNFEDGETGYFLSEDSFTSAASAALRYVALLNAHGLRGRGVIRL